MQFWCLTLGGWDMWESLDMGKCGKFPPKWRCILFIAEKTIELKKKLMSHSSMIFPWTCPFFGCSHMFPYLPIKSRWFPSVSSRRCWRQCHAGICLSPFIWRPGRIRLDLVKVQYVLWDHMRNMEIFGVFDGIMMDYLWDNLAYLLMICVWHNFWASYHERDLIW